MYAHQNGPVKTSAGHKFVRYITNAFVLTVSILCVLPSGKKMLFKLLRQSAAMGIKLLTQMKSLRHSFPG